MESTHEVFKSVESQVHQLSVSLESVTSHIAALAQLASLAANSGSLSFGGNAGGGGNGSATPRLGGSLRARPEVIDTRAGEKCISILLSVREAAFGLLAPGRVQALSSSISFFISDVDLSADGENGSPSSMAGRRRNLAASAMSISAMSPGMAK